ncbi:hypothetical protein GC175_22280 [bacterium]|nr:hypothetical protein [bacterium]
MYLWKPSFRLIAYILCISLLLQTPGLVWSAPTTRTQPGPTAADTGDLARLPTQRTVADQPAPLVDPLTISRVQSRYQTGGAVEITYTLHNNLTPTRAPETTAGAPVTDTVALLTTFDPTDDMNTLRQVAVTTTLASGVTFVDSSAAPSQNGGKLNWTLPAIPPGTSYAFTMTVQPPASAADFVFLEDGLAASATLWDTTTSASARPAQLAPDGVPAATVQASAEADPFDVDILWFSAKFQQDPLSAFEAVQAMAYEPYRGSLRGTRGTLWSNGGNSLDQATLLIAMLRAAGIPARYKQGTLTEADAKTLLASAFPTPAGVAGYRPASVTAADPVNDPDLVAIAQDHWWVEANLPGQGWTSLDPSFPGAAVGDSFAGGGQYDGVAAVPAAMQHTITLALTVEQYTAFPTNGTFLTEFSPLFGTFPTAQVAAKRVIFGQFVEDAGPTGAIFSSRQIVYQPYFGIEENNDAVLGDPFQDLLTNLPFATQATTAIWIEYTITDLDGNSESFRRPIKDLLGADVRKNGGEPNLSIDATNSPPFLQPDEQYVHWVLPNAVPEWAYTRQAVSALDSLLAIGDIGRQVLDMIPELGDSYTADQIDILVRTAGLHVSANRDQLALIGLDFARQSDAVLANLESGLRTELFYTTPRLFAVGAKLEEGGISANVDLRTTRVNAVVHPGQSPRAANTAQWIKGLAEGYLEGVALESMSAEKAVSAARIFAEMAAADIEPVIFHSGDIDLLVHYPYSAQGKAYMVEALAAGKSVLAPSAPVTIDGADELAWWQVDPVSGETVSVGENGLHPSALEWNFIQKFGEQLIIQIFEYFLNELLGQISDGWLGTPPGGAGLAQLIALLTVIGDGLNNIFMDVANAISSGGARSAATRQAVPDLSWAFLPAHLCPMDNCGVEQFVLAQAAASPIPLPDVQFAYTPDAAPNPAAGTLLSAVNSLPGQTSSAQLSTSGSSSTAPGQPVNVLVALAASFDGAFATFAYVPDGWAVAWGAGNQVVVTPPAGAGTGDHTILTVAQSRQYPDLVRSVEHTVTVTGAAQVTMSYAPEANITVPMGTAGFNAVSNQTNDGEMEIPNAAYRLTLTNSSTQAQSVNLTVSGAPADWLVLNGTRQSSAMVIVPAHSSTDVGLYVAPSSPPAPGTSFSMSVQMNSGAGSANLSIPWGMATQAFNFVDVQPDTLYLPPNGSVDFDVSFTNVGNGGGDFPVRADLPGDNWTLSSLPSSLSLSVGQQRRQTLTLTVDDDAILGQRYRLILAGDAPSSYTQYALADVQVISAQAGLLTAAADRCTVNDTLGAALSALAETVVELEYWCETGDCPLPLRDQVATAGQNVVTYARSAAQPVTLPSLAGVESASTAVGAATGDDDILAAVGVLAAAVDVLSGELCQVTDHLARARFTPYVDAVLMGDTATFSLDVTNQGAVTTTYAIAVTGLPGADLTFDESIAPGVTRNLPVDVTPTVLGIYDLTATVDPVVPDLTLDLRREARARLNVVDKFVQVTQVIADPPFVETGTSSADLRVEVANLSGVPQASNVDVNVIDRAGTTQFSQSEIAVDVSAGNPRVYDLATVNTSGWAEGVYTVTVDLRDAAGDMIPDGSGYGFFSVGQGLRVSQSVSPAVVAPGAVTVTTNITSRIDGVAIPAVRTAANRTTLYNAPFWQVEMSEAITPTAAATQQSGPSEIYLPAIQNTTGDTTEQATVQAADATVIAPGLVRYEETDAGVSFNGAWNNVNSGNYSGGSALRSEGLGNTATFTFTGTWLEIGLGETTDAGKVEVSIDSVSQGIFDLYGRDETSALIFGNLTNSQHVVQLNVVTQDNPFSNRNWVALDYLTVWDGSALPTGVFEHDDGRVLSSNGWSTSNDADAGAGNYGWRSDKTWFYFEGDSVGMQIVTDNGWDEMRISVDGEFVTKWDLYRTDIATETLSLDGFGPGLHVVELDEYRSNSVLDTFFTPGVAPFYQPPVIDGYTRFEEDDSALRYNGVPFGSTSATWALGQQAVAGNRYVAGSGTLSDTVSLTFDGTAALLGFYTSDWGGLAHVVIDGVEQEIVDTYSNEPGLLTRRYANLGAGTHTITVTVLDQRGSFALRDDVRLDFIDIWDGTGLANGRYEAEDRNSVFSSDNWNVLSDAGASDGRYLEFGSTAWFPFSGDSVGIVLPRDRFSKEMRLFVDDQFVGFVENYAPSFVTETLSFNGFGAGVHLLRLEGYRSRALADAFVTPGVAPFTDLDPPATGITRYEEHHPAIRYNGVPLAQTAQSWSRGDGIFANRSSEGQHAYSATADDTIEFDFSGSWLGIGFSTDNDAGQAEIAIDGNVLATVDLYTRVADTKSVYFDNLGSGAHTVTITVLGTSNPNAGRARVYFDFFDVWAGQALANGVFEESNDRVLYSEGWGSTNDADASGGSFAASSNGTTWFPFTGDSVTFDAWVRSNYHSIDIRIDGESQGIFNSYSLTPAIRSFSFSGLGDGPHVLEVRAYRGNVAVDSFTTPSTGVHYTVPAPGGVIRLEEDHPDLRYNGDPFRTMPNSWSGQGSLFSASGNYYAGTSAVSNTVSLDFNGSWVGVGFVNGGVVEIFIDGVSRGQVDTSTGVGGVSSTYFDDLADGTHTLSVTAVSGALNLDFVDTWDGQTLADGWSNADLDDYSGRFHFSNKDWWGRGTNQYAYAGDFVASGLPNVSHNLWFTFVGDGLTVLGFNRNNSTLQVIIDGQAYAEVDMAADYSDQPDTLHFPDLGPGPHVVQVHARNAGRVDAFEVNPAGFYDYVPQIVWSDDTGKEELDAGYGTGFLTTIGIGDLNGDGSVELVAPGVNGRLYVYRGDGADTGDGDPILWTSDLVGPAAEPALADLNNDGTAEIILGGENGLFAFRHDGTVLWQQNSIKMSSASNNPFGWGGPTLGNLDADPEAEIVVAASEDALYVLDHLGNVLDSEPIGVWPSVPVLADITGDGLLDIVSAQAHTLNVHEFGPTGSLELAWTYTLTDTTPRSGVFGSPAVADLTGDGNPEIIINWGHRVEAFRANGSLLWSYYTGSDNHFRPSPITVADVTGDGEINVVTASAISAGLVLFDHLLMVLKADGTLVWEQTVADSTASASGVAAQDLTGNGAWEILWNGFTDGFLVIRGADGKRLFNERVTRSGTIMEYPSMGDVTGDGVADVVVAGVDGLFVISHVGHWVDSRPLWNQHNYHVTNINDDWSIPATQPNNWDLSNTYRTQTPDRTPAPSFNLAFTYTEDLPNVELLPDTASTPLTSTPPRYTWDYRQEWINPVIVTSFDSNLSALQPGEVRQISAGTEVSYRLPSGMNRLTLPPLYVTAAGLAELTPPAQRAVIGGSTLFTLTLTNPSAAADSYSIGVGGVPAAWLSYPTSVPLAGGETTTVQIAVTVPADAEADVLPLIADVTNGSGGVDSVQATLTVFAGVEVAIAPPTQSTQLGVAVTYTVTLTNTETVTRTYALTTSYLITGLPASTELSAGANRIYTVTATSMVAGPQPLRVTARTSASGAVGAADAVLDVAAAAQAALQLSPDPLTVGPGSTSAFVLTVTNRGDSVETFDIAVDLPAGWGHQLQLNGRDVVSVTLPPAVLNSVELTLLVKPDSGASMGDYPVTARAVESNGLVAGATTATASVVDRGVEVQILGGPGSIDPRDGGTWNVQVRNSGPVADTFRLGVTGPVVGAAGLSASSVSLAPGAAQTVQLNVGNLSTIMPGGYPLQVTATSDGNNSVSDNDQTTVNVGGFEEIGVSWLQTSQTVDDGLSAEFTLVVTNRGSAAAEYAVSVDADDAKATVAETSIQMPPGSTLQLPVTVTAPRAGTYALDATVSSTGTSGSAVAAVTFSAEANFPIFLPSVTANRSGTQPTAGDPVYLPFVTAGE